MLKGVNHRIIEIKNLSSKYFESALLFVSPDYIDEDDSLLQREAEQTVDFFEGTFVYHKKPMKRSRMVVLSLLTAAAVTAGVLWFLL